MGQKEIQTVPREHYQFDITEMPLAKGYKYVYVWVDLATNFAILVPARTRKAGEIKRSLTDHIIAKFGVPSSIYSDNETAIRSSTVRGVCDSLDIKYSCTAPHSPWSNSSAENIVGMAKTLLRIYSHQYGKPWIDIWYMVNPPVNTRYLSKTRLTPEELLFGRINQTDELIRCNDLPENVRSQEYKRALQHKKINLGEIHENQRKRTAAQNREKINKSRKVSNIKLNDVVFMRDNDIRSGRGAAMDPQLIGPYTVWEMHSDGQTCTIKNIETGKLRRAHIQFLEKMTNFPSNLIAPVQLDDLVKFVNTPPKRNLPSSYRGVDQPGSKRPRRINNTGHRPGIRQDAPVGVRTRSRTRRDQLHDHGSGEHNVD